MRFRDAVSILAVLASALAGCATIERLRPDTSGPTATQAVAVGGPVTASPARSVTLDIPAGSYFAGPEGRGLLQYLVRCALSANTAAQVVLPDDVFNFEGGIGLAPEWAERGLTPVEQRWVSACMYALTNKLGKTVRVSVRGAHPRIDGKTDPVEQEVFTLHEGGFFGNIFLPNPVAYVCAGDDRDRMRDFAIGRLRLCAQPSGARNADGQQLSECGFVITGPCSSPSSFAVNGERIDEVVHTWLAPRGE